MKSRFYKPSLPKENDHRYRNKNNEEIIEFPPEIEDQLTISEINVASFEDWIKEHLEPYTTDEFAIGIVIGCLRNSTITSQELGQNLKAFIDNKESIIKFIGELWPLLKDAQNNENGIPSIILEETKLRIQARIQRIKELN